MRPTLAFAGIRCAFQQPVRLVALATLRRYFANAAKARMLRLQDPYFRSKQNTNPDQRDLTRNIHTLGRKGQWQDAVALFCSHQQPDGITFAATVDACCKGDPPGISTALQLFNDMPIKNPEVFTSFINMCAKSKDIVSAEQWWKQTPAYHVTPTAGPYGSIITAFIQAGDAASAEDKLAEMRRNELKPDRFTYNTLLSAWARQGDVSRVRQHFDSMIEQGIVPDEMHGSEMVKACIVKKDKAAAMKTSKWLKEKHKLTVDAVSNPKLWKRIMQI